MYKINKRNNETKHVKNLFFKIKDNDPVFNFRQNILIEQLFRLTKNNEIMSTLNSRLRNHYDDNILVLGTYIEIIMIELSDFCKYLRTLN